MKDSRNTPPSGSCVWCSAPLSVDGLCGTCFDKWPKCAIPACQNKSCLRLNSKFCWPHTPGQMEPEDIDLLEEEEGEDTNVEDSYAR